MTLAVGGSNAITPVGIVTYFRGESQALLKEGAKAAAAKNVNIQANADKEIKGYTIGAAAAGGMGLSGAVNVIVTKDKTKAAAEYGTDITAKNGDLNIKAHSDYVLRAESAAVALSVANDPNAIKLAVAVNAVVSVLQGSTIAQLDGKATAKNNKVNVNAYSKRDVIDAAASVSGGVFGNSVGVTLLALVAGAKMSQDASDMLVYGNAKEKSGNSSTFDAGKFLKHADVNGSSKYYDTEIVYDEDGNPVMEDVVDENGNPVLDENDNPVQQEKRRATGGDTVYDGDGNPVMDYVYDKNGKLVMEDVYDENGNPVMEDVYDENGDLIVEDVLDENGNPVMEDVLDDDGNVATEIVLDADNNPVLDEDGNVKTQPKQQVKQQAKRQVKQQPKQQTRTQGSLSESLAKDLLGNGHRESEETVGSKDKKEKDQSTFDASSKYRSDDFDNKDFNEDGEEGRGENLNNNKTVKTKGEDGTIENGTRDDSDTQDVKNAKNMNVYTYEDPKDAVIARITANAAVEAKQR